MGENKLKKRNEIPEKQIWNIASFYPNKNGKNAWEKDFAAAKKSIAAFASFENQNLLSEKPLLAALTARDKTLRLVESVFTYARMKRDEDMNDAARQELLGRAMNLLTETEMAFAFLGPKLSAYNEKKIFALLEKNPKLKKYRYEFEVLFRRKKHILSRKEEDILAGLSETLNAPSEIFDMLTDADFVFGKIKDEKGRPTEMTQERYGKFLESKNRRVRKAAYDALYSVYEGHVNSISAAYASSVKADVALARARHFNSAIERALSSDNVKTELYDNLINETHAALPTLHKYLALRKKILSLKKLSPWDLYVPLVDVPKKDITFEEGVKLIAEALAPLGKDYVADLKQGIADRWVDYCENEGKASGAYSFGSYDSAPFVLMSFTGRMRDVFTLAHEMGHSLHSFYTRRTQPFIYGGHSIFTAEVASTVNESLLISHLARNAKNKAERAHYINMHIEGFRTTLIRQTMFAEFERDTHAMVEAGEALTKEKLTRSYRGLNEKYFGAALEVDDKLAIEWARIPHFYRAFYVYKYATGYSAATAIVSGLESGETPAKQYISFLKSGSCGDPVELLKLAGVDMEKPVPVQRALETFKKRVDELEEML